MKNNIVERYQQGERAFYDAYLRNADLSWTNLGGANLSGADLRRANLRGVNLNGANLVETNFSGANLWKANLGGANLTGATLYAANLGQAKLDWAILERVNLGETCLIDTNLSGAALRWADLTNADLTGADLRTTDLSGAKGLQSAASWIEENLTTDELGVIVYKAFGVYFKAPAAWNIAPGSFIEEVVNPLRTLKCACGINVATLEWITGNTDGYLIWKGRIRWRDLPDVVVPYGTEGKFRCGRLELLEVIRI